MTIDTGPYRTPGSPGPKSDLEQLTEDLWNSPTEACEDRIMRHAVEVRMTTGVEPPNYDVGKSAWLSMVKRLNAKIIWPEPERGGPAFIRMYTYAGEIWVYVNPALKDDEVRVH